MSCRKEHLAVGSGVRPWPRPPPHSGLTTVAQSGGQAERGALGHVGPAAGGLPVLPPPPGPGGALRVPPSFCKQLPCAAPAQATASLTGRQFAGRPHLAASEGHLEQPAAEPKGNTCARAQAVPARPSLAGLWASARPGAWRVSGTSWVRGAAGGGGSGRRALEELPGPSGDEGRQGASCIVYYAKASHRTHDISGHY